MTANGTTTSPTRLHCTTRRFLHKPKPPPSLAVFCAAAPQLHSPATEPNSPKQGCRSNRSQSSWSLCQTTRGKPRLSSDVLALAPASLFLCITAELWWCFWGACPQTNPLPVGTCRHVWFKTLVRRGGCACLAPWSRLAQQDRRHRVTTQMVAAASRNGHRKAIAGTSISKCPKQPLPVQLNFCSQETPPTPHFLLIFELQHQQSINM